MLGGCMKGGISSINITRDIYVFSFTTGAWNGRCFVLLTSNGLSLFSLFDNSSVYFLSCAFLHFACCRDFLF